MTEIDLQRDVLDDNAVAAAANRHRFAAAGVYVMNLMSGPGAGKTTLLEGTLAGLAGRLRVAVVAADLETRRDADRLARHGAPVVQINTAGACHTDARMLAPALDQLDLAALDVLIVENVGNLVCPAEFDLGEHDKVMILSVTEGADKPAKYPLMFHESRLMILSKIDLLPHVDFDCDAAIADARALNPGLEVLRLSSRSGEGLEAWFQWIEARCRSLSAGKGSRTLDS
jgi:hydrogenase nickel incorporation protein HypB